MAIFSLSAGFALLPPKASVPPDVQIHAIFSRTQAAQLFRKSHQQLRHSYWVECWAQIRNRQFSEAWKRIKLGQGQIKGIVKDQNGEVLTYAKYCDGSGSWTRLNKQ